MAEIGCNWARIGPSKSSQSLSIAHKWAVLNPYQAFDFESKSTEPQLSCSCKHYSASSVEEVATSGLLLPAMKFNLLPRIDIYQQLEQILHHNQCPPLAYGLEPTTGFIPDNYPLASLLFFRIHFVPIAIFSIGRGTSAILTDYNLMHSLFALASIQARTESTATLGAKLVTVPPKSSSYEEEEKNDSVEWWCLSSLSDNEGMEFANGQKDEGP
ncbi:hypothetical protein Tco_1458654 [Tanacetum coccineum]